MPTVSIAMATYNGAKYLREQLDSLAAQTLLPNELVVCDDGSTDATRDILDALAVRSPFAVRVERNAARLGVSANFDRAMSLCAGDIVFMCDQDDVWLPSKIERVVAAFDAQTMVIHCDEMITDANLKPDGTTILGRFQSVGNPFGTAVAGCATAVRREFLRCLLPTDPLEGYDVWINVIAWELGVQKVLREPLQYFRRHGANASNLPGDPNQRRVPQQPFGKARLAMLDARISLYPRLANELPAVADKATELATSMRREREVLARRIAIRELPRAQRVLPVLKWLLMGRYAVAGGWLTAAKDIATGGRITAMKNALR